MTDTAARPVAQRWGADDERGALNLLTPEVVLEATRTPKTGVVGPSRSISASDTPASFGVHGPGEITIRCGASRSICSTVSASLRSTRTSAPSSCRYWTRLKVKLS